MKWKLTYNMLNFYPQLTVCEASITTQPPSMPCNNTSASHATSIPRCYFELLAIEEGHCSLIGFCNTSAGAYAAVVYLRVEGSAGTTVTLWYQKHSQ